MSEGTSAEPLPVTLGQEYRVKLGQSFTFPHKNAFHALKYDFKPQSVDSKRPGHLKITEEGAVNVSLPVGQSESEDDCVQFRGPKKSCAKECILIINRDTGEAILERISDTVQLKAIRDGRKPMHPRDRSVSPSPFHTQSKATPPKPTFKSSSSHTLNPPSKQHGGGGGGGGGGNIATTVSGNSSKKVKQSSKFSTKDANSKSGVSRMEKPSKGKLVKSNSQPTRGVPTSQNSSSLHPKLAGISSSAPGSGGGGGGSGFADTGSSSEGLGYHREISPLRSSANPTPEPRPPVQKRPKLSSSSLSSSSSSGSDSDSIEWETIGRPKPAMIPPAKPIHASNSSKESVSSNHSTHGASSSPSFQNTGGVARSSSAGRSDMSGRASSSAAAVSSSHVQFLDAASARLMGQRAGGQEAESRLHPAQQAVPFHGQFDYGGSQPMSEHAHPVVRHPISHPRAASTSSSSSESESSSGASSSESSSESDEENDREVAAAFHKAPPTRPPDRQMSMSLLRSDLNMSESGSDSDT